MNIYVGNVDYHLSEDQLKELFEEFGEVSSVKIVTDKFTGRSKGFGFVEMDNDAEAQEAIDALNGKTVNNREITVNKARPKTEGGGGNFNRGGGGNYGNRRDNRYPKNY